MSRHRPTPPRIAVAVALLFAIPAPLLAQHIDSLVAGARVRATLRFPQVPWVIGTLIRSYADTLTIVTASSSIPREVAIGDIRRLELFAGNRPSDEAFAQGAKVGALVGLALSAVMMTAAIVEEERHPCGDCYISGKVVAAVLSVPVTGLSTLIGGFVGVGTRDRWVPVPLR